MPGLNIAAKRKVSLKGFAEGWDDCYITVRAVNETERKEHVEHVLELNRQFDEVTAKGDDVKTREVAQKLDSEVEVRQRQFVADLIQGGVVMSTDDDGTTKAVEFGREDVPDVMEALGFAWVTEIADVATGADRLKARMTSGR